MQQPVTICRGPQILPIVPTFETRHAPLLIRLGLWFAPITCGLLLGACANETPGIDPPRDSFYFPTGLALDLNLDARCQSDAPLLYVSNSNADLRFNGGTIQAVSLGGLPEDLAAPGASEAVLQLGCQTSRDGAYRWECPANAFILPQATVKIGDFPNELGLAHQGRRLFTPVRVEPWSLYWFDTIRLSDPDRIVDIRCNSACASTGSDADCDEWTCDELHQISQISASEPKAGEALPREPFGMAVHQPMAVHIDSNGLRHTCTDGFSDATLYPCSCGNRPRCSNADRRECCVDPQDPGSVHVYVVHADGGEIAFFQSKEITLGEQIRSPVQLRDFRAGFFTTIDTDDDDQNNYSGGFGLALSLTGDATSPVFASSRVDDRLATFAIQDDQSVVQSAETTISAIDPGDDIRGVAFDAGSQRLYVVSRAPSSLVAVDMSLENGQPKRETLWAVPTCSQPSLIRVGPDPFCVVQEAARLTNQSTPATCPSQSLQTCLMQRPLVYVVCFAEALITVIDGARGSNAGVIYTGSGPNTLEFDFRPEQGVMRAFVANFLDNTIGVIDMWPNRESYRRMALRIGQVEDLLITQ